MLLIDPKGDLPNLCLTFPDLRPEDFAPWVNEDDARRKGLAVDAYAAQQAELWRKGLAAWGEDGARIRRLREAADVAVYTPGSTAGLPVSIVKSFAAPAAAVRDDTELFRDRIGTTATSLLGLLGIEADPLRSREHILLAKLFEAAWREGRDLDLPGIIQQIQSPPIAKVGALDLEAFFPAKDRFELATRLNNLLAAPGFDAWLEGEPLDIGALLHTPEGKPRAAIFSIAHLSDAERMFFVSLLLNEMLGWVRAQSGTTSLRALLYMDEIFGYFPPVANPPSKLPLLTLLKQARAFGVGVVLATQNPVDLDYKGLANTGTWFIGRLQTERDRARVLDGLEGAAAGGDTRFDRGRDGGDPGRAREPGLPPAQRARGRARGLRDPLGDVLPARPADAHSDQAAHGGPEAGSGRPAGGAAARTPRQPRTGGRRQPRAGAQPRPACGRCSRPAFLSTSCPCAGPRPRAPRSSTSPWSLGAATRALREREGGRRPERGGRRRDPRHGGSGPGELGGRGPHRRRRRRPRGRARRRRRVGAAPLGRRQAQELRGLEPGPGGVALRAAAARAPPRPRLGRALESGRERARLPGAGPRGIPGRARRARRRPFARSTRPSARRSRSGSGGRSRRRPGSGSR